MGSARDIARQVGTPIVIDLGRHMNDHMVSFYAANPSHFAIEYGWGGRTIDDSCWQVGRYESVSSHSRVAKKLSKPWGRSRY